MPKRSFDKRNEHGPFDIMGDLHGCYVELLEMLAKLGYAPDPDGIPKHPEGRRVIFVGDLCDRGPNSMGVLKLVMKMAEEGRAFCVMGNHDNKLMRYLEGRNVQLTNGLDKTVAELEDETAAFRRIAGGFLRRLPSHVIFDDGKLVVAHAGLKEELQGQESERVRSFALYGDTNGKTDEYGFPIRRDWAKDYRGEAVVVYGHIPLDEPYIIHNTYGIDTSCVFGGKLSALRYPELEIVSVKAKEAYASRR